MPDLVDVNPQSDIEYFSSPDEVLNQDDLIEADVRVLGWNKKFRIRALTFGQMDTINKNATDPDSGNLNMNEWAYWTITEGVVRPKFKINQARRLIDANGEYVRQLADQIWEIGRLSKTIWDEFIKESNRAAKSGKDDIKDLVANEETKAET